MDTDTKTPVDTREKTKKISTFKLPNIFHLFQRFLDKVITIFGRKFRAGSLIYLIITVGSFGFIFIILTNQKLAYAIFFAVIILVTMMLTFAAMSPIRALQRHSPKNEGLILINAFSILFSLVVIVSAVIINVIEQLSPNFQNNNIEKITLGIALSLVVISIWKAGLIGLTLKTIYAYTLGYFVTRWWKSREKNKTPQD